MDSIFAYGSDSDQKEHSPPAVQQHTETKAPSPLNKEIIKDTETKVKRKRKRKKSKRVLLNALGIHLDDIAQGKSIYLDEPEDNGPIQIKDRSKETGFEAKSYSLNQVREHQPWIRQEYESDLVDHRPTKKQILDKMQDKPQQAVSDEEDEPQVELDTNSSASSLPQKTNADFLASIQQSALDSDDDEFETDMSVYNQQIEVETIQPALKKTPKMPSPSIKKLNVSALPQEAQDALASNTIQSVQAGVVSDKDARLSQAERHRRGIFEREHAQLQQNLNESKYAHSNNAVMRMARQAASQFNKTS